MIWTTVSIPLLRLTGKPLCPGTTNRKSQIESSIFRPAGMFHSGCSCRMMQQRLNRAPALPYRLPDGFGDIAADCYAGDGNSRVAVCGSEQDGRLRKAGKNRACEVGNRADRMS